MFLNWAKSARNRRGWGERIIGSQVNTWRQLVGLWLPVCQPKTWPDIYMGASAAGACFSSPCFANLSSAGSRYTAVYTGTGHSQLRSTLLLIDDNKSFILFFYLGYLLAWDVLMGPSATAVSQRCSTLAFLKVIFHVKMLLSYQPQACCRAICNHVIGLFKINAVLKSRLSRQHQLSVMYVWEKKCISNLLISWPDVILSLTC